MNITNTATRYGALSIFIHWATAVLVIGLIALGLYMEELPKGPDKLEWVQLHKSLGVLALALVAVRLLWTWINRRPAAPQTGANWERLLTRTTRLLLWAGLIGLPLSGWIMSAAGGREVSFFGLFALPAIVAENHTLHELAEELHEILGQMLIPVILLHIAGALKHHFVNRDDTLMRMLPRRADG